MNCAQSQKAKHEAAKLCAVCADLVGLAPASRKTERDATEHAKGVTEEPP